MWQLFALLGFISLVSGPTLLKFSADLSSPFHQFCQSLIRAEGDYVALYSALSCGTPLYIDAHLSQLIRENGLAHLFVVSGAHLIFLEGGLRKLGHHCRMSDKTRGLILFVFVLCNQLRAPIFRAWTQLVVKKVSRKLELNWSSSHCCFAAGLICLALFPNWWLSFSLQLSWLASVSIGLSRRMQIWPPLGVYIALLPALAQWSPLHPMTILTNGLAGVLFAWGLFPLSLLASFTPYMHHLVDPAWDLFLQFLRLTPQGLAYQPLLEKNGPLALWIYILTLQWLAAWFFPKTGDR